jgi:hypothetical protein
MSDFMDRFIGAFSVLGLIVLLALAYLGTGEQECTRPITQKVITL